MHSIENQIVDSSFSAIINAPIEQVDIPKWCFTLPEKEYQGCSPAHIAAGFTTAPDGTRMSINVETIGGSLMVQHYLETLGEKDHLILDSDSDVFTPNGRVTIHETRHPHDFTGNVAAEDMCQPAIILDLLQPPAEIVDSAKIVLDKIQEQRVYPHSSQSIPQFLEMQVVNIRFDRAVATLQCHIVWRGNFIIVEIPHRDYS